AIGIVAFGFVFWGVVLIRCLINLGAIIPASPAANAIIPASPKTNVSSERMLVDPREGGDGDIDGTIGGPKTLSRVFVVVLVDSANGLLSFSCVCRRINKLSAYGIK
ncbi:hypothetical protein HID58_080166, partial [Brassica napus]